MKEQVGEKSEGVPSETEAPPRSERRRTIEDAEPGAVRIKLPQAIGIKAKEIVAELKGRGAQVTLDELLSKYLEAMPDRYFEEQLLQRTPEPYYLEAATKVPELREMLIRHAKKGLMRASSSELPREPRKRRARHRDDDTEAQANPIAAAGE